MKVAILVIDMINTFLKDEKHKYIIEPTRKFLNKIVYNNNLIVFCNDCHTEEDPEIKIWGKHAMNDTDDCHLIDELLDIYVENSNADCSLKTTYSAFFNTDLNDILKRAHIDTVILCGVLTSICVRHTAADAFYNGYNVIINSECVHDENEIYNVLALGEMKKLYGAKILISEEIYNELKI